MTPGGNEVSFCRERGGIITSLKFGGKEILYMDSNSLNNDKASVRGGIPVLFPNAGTIDSTHYIGLKRHGFARDSLKWQSDILIDGFKEVLLSSEDNIYSYPYDFRLSIEGKFDNNTFIINQKAENLEVEKDMPISMGLHPYFKVLNSEKKNIKFNFDGGKYVEDNIELWANGKYVSFNNPKIDDNKSVMEVLIPGIGTLHIDASAEYKNIWVWSLPDKDFICIEPVMRDDGGLVNNPEIVKSKQALNAYLKIWLSD